MKLLKKFATVILGLVIAYFFVINIWEQNIDLKSFISKKTIIGLSLSTLPLFAIGWTNAYCWQIILQEYAHRITLRQSFRIYFLPQFGKYLPGKIWSYAILWKLGEGIGLPAAEILKASLIQQVIYTLFSLLIGGFSLLPFMLNYRILLGLAALGALAGLVLMNPVLTLVEKLLRLRRKGIHLAISRRTLLRACTSLLLTWSLFYVASLLFFGVAFELSPLDILQLNGAYAIAWFIGYYSLITPGGLGVREGTLYLLLHQMMSPSKSLLLPLAMRLWITFYEIMTGAIALSIKKHEHDSSVQPVRK